MNKLFFSILAILFFQTAHSQCPNVTVNLAGQINGNTYLSGSSISSSCGDIQIKGDICWKLLSSGGDYYVDLFADGIPMERQVITQFDFHSYFTFDIMPGTQSRNYTVQLRKLDGTLVATSDSFTVAGISSYSTQTQFTIDDNAVVVDLDNDGPDDLVAISNSGGYCNIVGWKGTDFGYTNEGVLWSTPTSSYSANFVLGRIAAGDFDHDGQMDDIAMLYNLGANASALHVSIWNGTSYNTPQTWLSQSSLGGYESSRVTGRFASGDFDADGYIDDIAMMYDYGQVSGSYKSRIHVYQSTGSAFSSGSGATWLTEATLGGYNAANVKYRFVSGNFDGDGRVDDIAMMYDYGNGTGNYISRIHVYTGNGSVFSSGTAFVTPPSGSTWINESSIGAYTANKVSRRFVSGDFDGDLIHDDIAAMYDYGSNSAAIHVFIGNSTSFSQQTWVSTSSFGSVSCSSVGGNFFSVEQNDDYSKASSEIVLIYPYYYGFPGYDNYRFWSFVGSPIANEGHNLATSFGQTLTNYLYCDGTKSVSVNSDGAASENERPFIIAYPNPVNDIVKIQSEVDEYTLEIYTVEGKMVAAYDNPVSVPVDQLPNGIYVFKFFTGTEVCAQNIVKN